MTNPLFSDDIDTSHKKTRFDPNQFSLDANNDGRVDERDFEQPPLDKVPDDRSNLRRLHRLRAEDILLERARTRAEERDLRIISDEEARLRQERKSPIRQKAERAIASLGDATRSYLERDDAPPFRPQRPRARAPPQQAQPGLRQRLNQYGEGVSGGTSVSQVDNFAAGLLPRAQAPTPARATRPQAGQGDTLAQFSRNVMGNSAPTRKPQRNAARPAKNVDTSLKNFSKNLMGKKPVSKKRRLY